MARTEAEWSSIGGGGRWGVGRGGEALNAKPEEIKQAIDPAQPAAAAAQRDHVWSAPNLTFNLKKKKDDITHTEQIGTLQTKIFLSAI